MALTVMEMGLGVRASSRRHAVTEGVEGCLYSHELFPIMKPGLAARVVFHIFNATPLQQERITYRQGNEIWEWSQRNS